MLTRSDKKYTDPTDVLKSIVDQFGRTIEIGDEKDISEFNQTFLARISEGFNYKKNKSNQQEEDNKMVVDEESKPQSDLIKNLKKEMENDSDLNSSSIVQDTE